MGGEGAVEQRCASRVGVPRPSPERRTRVGIEGLDIDARQQRQLLLAQTAGKLHCLRRVTQLLPIESAALRD